MQPSPVLHSRWRGQPPPPPLHIPAAMHSMCGAPDVAGGYMHHPEPSVAEWAVGQAAATVDTLAQQHPADAVMDAAVARHRALLAHQASQPRLHTPLLQLHPTAAAAAGGVELHPSRRLGCGVGSAGAGAGAGACMGGVVEATSADGAALAAKLVQCGVAPLPLGAGREAGCLPPTLWAAAEVLDAEAVAATAAGCAGLGPAVWWSALCWEPAAGRLTLLLVQERWDMTLRAAAGGRLSAAVVLSAMGRLWQAVRWAADRPPLAGGLVHADVHAGNVLLRRVPGRGWVAGLADWGRAVVLPVEAGAAGATAAAAALAAALRRMLARRRDPALRRLLLFQAALATRGLLPQPPSPLRLDRKPPPTTPLLAP